MSLYVFTGAVHNETSAFLFRGWVWLALTIIFLSLCHWLGVVGGYDVLLTIKNQPPVILIIFYHS